MRGFIFYRTSIQSLIVIGQEYMYFAIYVNLLEDDIVPPATLARVCNACNLPLIPNYLLYPYFSFKIIGILGPGCRAHPRVVQTIKLNQIYSSQMRKTAVYPKRRKKIS